MTQRRSIKNQGRPKANWGALVSSLIGVVGGAYSAHKQQQIAETQMREQARLAQQQAEMTNNINRAASINNSYNADNITDDDYYNLRYKHGGKVRRKLKNGFTITDGGDAIAIDNNTFLLRGGSHEDVNELGKTGIGINYGGEEVEAQGGEAVEITPNGLRIYSDEPMYADGSSSTDRILAGENKDKVFKAQSRFNRLRQGIRPVEERPKAKWGMSTIGSDYINLAADVVSALGSWALGDRLLRGINYKYDMPEFVEEAPVSMDTKYHNEAQLAEVERNRERARNIIRGNTASSSVALGRMQTSDTDAMTESNKLQDERLNKETELRNKQAELEQQFRGRYAHAKNQYYQDIAKFKKEEIDANNKLALSRAQSASVNLSGIGTAVNNVVTQGQQRYQDEQALKAYLAASGPGTISTMQAMGYDFSPAMKQSIYDAQKTYFDSNPNDNQALTRYNIAGRALYGDNWNNKALANATQNNKTSISNIQGLGVLSPEYLPKGTFIEPYNLNRNIWNTPKTSSEDTRGTYDYYKKHGSWW